MKRAFLWPREHGAWAMLLFPFFGALAVSRDFRWESVAAFAAVIGVFLLQEPMLVLLRQRLVWKERRAAASNAWYSVLVAGIPTLAATAILFWKLPLKPLAALTVVAGSLLVLRAILTLSNRQRSSLLQVVESAGLTTTALLGYLSVRGELDATAFLLWGAFSIHHSAAIFVVRARLEAIAGLKAGAAAGRRFRTTAWVSQSVLLAATIAALVKDNSLLGLAFAIPLVLHTLDLLRLANTTFLRTPLVKVGWREVAISTSFSVVAISSFAL